MTVTLFACFPGGIRQAGAVDYAAVLKEKMQYEKLLEDSLRSKLKKVLGIENVDVVVTVTPDTEEIVTEQVTREKIGEAVKGEKKKKKKWTLPGVPVKTELGVESEVVVEENVDVRTTHRKSVRLPESLVKKLSVIILLDETTSDDNVSRARALVEKVLRIDYKRGDSIEISKYAFAKPAPPPELTQVEKVLAEINKFPPYITWTAALLFLFMFAFFPIRFFTRGLARVLQLAPPRETKVNIGGNAQLPGQGGVLPGAGGEAAGGRGGGYKEVERIIVEKRVGDEEDLKEPFNYIDASNLNHLVYLLQKESSENISMVLAFLDPEYARQVLASLPSEKKSEVTTMLAMSKEMSPRQLAVINKDIKKKIDFIVDGTDRLSAILDQSDKATRNEIFEFLRKKDPELAERIKKSLFTFENVIGLGTEDLQRVLREVNLDILGEALRDVSEDFRDKIYDKISEGAASMIKQEIELGRPMSQKKIEDAQHQIVRVVRKLEKEGEIEVRKKSENEEESAPVPDKAEIKEGKPVKRKRKSK